MRMWSGIAVVCGLALCGSSASAQRGLEGLSPERVMEGLDQSDWLPFGSGLARDDGEVLAWVWPVARGEEGGAVALYVGSDEGRVDALAEQIGAREGAALVRSRSVILAVMIEGGSEEDSRALLNALLRFAAEGDVQQDAFGPLFDEEGVSGPVVLPDVRVGALDRVGALQFMMGQGFALEAQPEVIDEETYEAVTYTFGRGGARVVLTLYQCVTGEVARRLAGRLKGRTEAASLLRGNGLVTVLSLGEGGLAREVIKGLEGVR